MVFGIFLFAVNDVMGKWLVATYSVGQVLLLRSAAALVVLLVLIGRKGFTVRASDPARTACGAGDLLDTRSGLLLLGRRRLCPLADVMTYYLAGPLYVAAFAVFWLGEQLDRQRIATIVVGFIGVIIVLRPSSASLTPARFHRALRDRSSSRFS